MAVARYLVDTSAVARSHVPVIAKRLGPLFERGDVLTCSILELEAIRSARTADDAAKIRSEHRGMQMVPIEQVDFDRAADVLTELARSGHHRAVGLADLLIAAVAERGELTLLHYDADFDTIARVTDQRTEWVVARGSVP